MDNSDSDTSGEFSPNCFRIVRRFPAPKKPRLDADQEAGADAMYMPTPILVALSPDPPSTSSPVFDDAGSVETFMAMDTRSTDPSHRSESGAQQSQQTWHPALSMRPPYTVDNIYTNFMEHRGALILALTKDQEAFFQKCDPGMQPLHLYGSTDGSWEVKPTQVNLPAPEPEPTLGINLWRDTMERHKWLQQVAVHSDAWLMRISSFAASYISATERGQLFAMITGLPTVQEILVANMYQVEENRSTSPEANAVVEEREEVHYAEEKKSCGPDEANEVVEGEREVYLREEQRSSGHTEDNEVLEEMEEDGTNNDDNICASCYDHYNRRAFWISCNSCHKWYHGKCVNITSSEAEHIEQYECPDCYLDRVGYCD